jgi:hypothetical protein
LVKRGRLAWTRACVVVAAIASGTGFELGRRRGIDAGSATTNEFSGVACGIQALGVLEDLERGRRDAAASTLDSMIDVGIALHWLRLERPEYYANSLSPSTELVGHLARYRREHPSTAAAQTPNLNRLVTEYLGSEHAPR